MTGKRVAVTTDYHEKQLQRALLQFSRPENANLVREALKLAGREDLIGSAPGCIITANARDKAWSGKDGKKTDVRGDNRQKSGKKPADKKQASFGSKSAGGKKPTKKPQSGKGRGR